MRPEETLDDMDAIGSDVWAGIGGRPFGGGGGGQGNCICGPKCR